MDKYIEERLQQTNETLENHPNDRSRILREILRNQKAIMLIIGRE